MSPAWQIALSNWGIVQIADPHAYQEPDLSWLTKQKPVKVKQNKVVIKSPELIHAKCEYCGNIFTKKRVTQVYCCQSCSGRGSVLKHAANRPVQKKICRHCENPFETATVAVYCGRTCKDNAAKFRNGRK